MCLRLVTRPNISGAQRTEFLRYVLNGLFATVVHYSMLMFGLEVLRLPSAGLANFLAAIFGITASFIGNRYFVFRNYATALTQQAWRFAALYAVIAIMHATLLLFWTDLGGLDYRAGFLVASVMQFILSYFGNKSLVFAK